MEMSRRQWLRHAVAGAGFVAAAMRSPWAILRGLVTSAEAVEVDCVEGKRVLVPVTDGAASGLVAPARAQWGPVVTPRFQWVCDYFGQCGWLDTWNPYQVQFYLSNLSAQYAWFERQRQLALMAAMRSWAMRGYQVSQPFVLAEVQSVYAMGRGLSQVLFGIEAHGRAVAVDSYGVLTANVVFTIESRIHGMPEAQRCAGPQSDTFETTAPLNDGDANRVEVVAFATPRGHARITKRRFADRLTGQMGPVVIWDSAAGVQRSLVPV